MFDFTNPENIGKDYNGFYLISVDNLDDYKTKGVYLRHKKTGLEVYHILSEDDENLFAFGLRTAAKNSKGIAHIMEHSTLCGSERFPLKEPFNTLENQSVKTFLNAITYPDKTVYPAASTVRSDYFNLMDVYADAVFFPLLAEETFLQEGHRLELDDNGKLSVQGVVYNEMKAVYSSFYSVSIDVVTRTLFPDSFPSFDSGGDPLEISQVSYKEFLEFHEKYYRPDNCMLFLYGNISTSDQLDFLNERFMGRIEKKYGVKSYKDDFESKQPLVDSSIRDLLQLNKNKSAVEMYGIGPDAGATGSLVTMNYYAGEFNLENFVLSEVLIENSISPLTVKLKESGLGEDVSPLNGIISQTEENYFSFGLCDVKKGNEEKVKKLISDSIQELYNKGIPEDLLESSLMSIDFDFREVTRSSGPHSLVLMNRVLACWVQGNNPDKRLHLISDFELVKQKFRNDKDYLKKLIKLRLIDNKNTSFVVVEPSKKYLKNRNSEEKKYIKALSKNVDKANLKNQLEVLHKYQQKVETAEELSCIPHLNVSDLNATYKDIKTQFSIIKTKAGNEVPLIYNEESTNGIVYVEIFFPFDVLPVSDYPDIPVFLNSLTDLGWAGKGWQKANTEAASVVRDIWCDYYASPKIVDLKAEENLKAYENLNVKERDWMTFVTSFLSEFTDRAFDVMKEIITEMDFDDVEKFDEILVSYASEMKSSVISSALRYSTRRASYSSERNAALHEIFSGITQVEKINDFKKCDRKQLLKRYALMYKKIISSGGIIHITTDNDSMKKVLPLLSDFAEKCGLKMPEKAVRPSLEKLLPYVSQRTEGDFPREVLKASTQTGYAITVSPCTLGLNRESVAEDAFTRWLSVHSLWDKIRTTGGAYGAHAASNKNTGLLRICTYRDPHPEKNTELFLKILKDASMMDFSQDDVDCSIISCFSDEMVPESPEARGNRGCRRFLNGGEGFFEKYLELLLDLKTEDFKQAAMRLYKNSLNKRSEVIFCDKSKNTYGNIVHLPL